MQELVGRLTALDPAASASLKVIGYFDALVAGQVSVEVLCRSAAVLAGCAAGIENAGRGLRASPEGNRLAAGGSDGWSSHDTGDGGRVWIERSGPSHENDPMLLERFALAVAITESRTRGDAAQHRAAELVVDPDVPDAERAAAAGRLRLDHRRAVRAVATTLDSPADGRHPSAVLATPFGLVRLTLMDAEERLSLLGVRAGLGLPVEPARLPESWASALVAVRLADESAPVVDAVQLGALLVLAEAADTASDAHPDVAALETVAADPSALATLDALVADGSLRAAAVALGVHHSTVQARLNALSQKLGYDPRTSTGRTRYTVARTLHRLRHAAL